MNDNLTLQDRNKEEKARLPIMAICYDFDKTLSPDDMQAFTLIPSFGVNKETFWEEADHLARENLMDKNLAWMYQLINYSRLKRTPIKREYFNRIGADVALYNGVTEWFDNMNGYAEQHGIHLEHYIISSGLKEIIEGSPIASKIKRIYASTYLYTTDGVAEWPAQAVNYTNKTQFIFRISKGIFEEYDEDVNNNIPDNQRHVNYENIVYIGDSATDIPCMQLVKQKGGFSIGVFDPKMNNRKNVYQLYNDERLSFFAPANYSPGSELSKYMHQIIDVVAARETMRAEQNELKSAADSYKVYRETEHMMSEMATDELAPDRDRMNKALNELKKKIIGNID